MRILLGGIPLGCDNIGDEAIIASVVNMLKEMIPNVELTVATADSATAGLLGVSVVPPFGFAGHGLEGFAETVASHDAYIWCGATGLSDYPNVALDLLEIAQSRNIATFVWGVGMDNELNPAFFKVHGRRRQLLGLLGLVDWYERRLKQRLSKRFATIMPRCKGVWLRDPQSVAMLATMGFDAAGVAADTAFTLHLEQQHITEKQDAETFGICISTQRQVADLDGVKALVADVRAAGFKVLGIPMNPITDSVLLKNLGIECISGTSPEAVMEAASRCRLVLSSRLHLLILAANVGVMGLGIARGSKLDNWLANFGMKTDGSVYDCDWKALTLKVIASMKEQGDWTARRENAYSMLRQRFEAARKELLDKLTSR